MQEKINKLINLYLDGLSLINITYFLVLSVAIFLSEDFLSLEFIFVLYYMITLFLISISIFSFYAFSEKLSILNIIISFYVFIMTGKIISIVNNEYKNTSEMIEVFNVGNIINIFDNIFIYINNVIVILLITLFILVYKFSAKEEND